MAYVAPSTVTTLQTYSSAAHNIIVNDIISFRNGTGIVPPMCKATRTGQSISAGTIGILNFDTEAYDTDTMFAPTRNYVQINTAGVYIVSGQVLWPNSSGSGSRGALLYVNATLSGSGDSATYSSGGTLLAESVIPNQFGTEMVPNLSVHHEFAANDKIYIAGYNNNATTTIGASYLCVARIGSTS